MKRISETAIEPVLLTDGYAQVDGKDLDRERTLFPADARAFIQGTQLAVWQKLEALRGEQTSARVLESLCKWLDAHSTLVTLRHGFKCFGKTLRVAFCLPVRGGNLGCEAGHAAVWLRKALRSTDLPNGRRAALINAPVTGQCQVYETVS